MNKMIPMSLLGGLILLAVPPLMTGCGGGSSSSDRGPSATEPASVTQATVANSINWVESTVPGCTVATAGASVTATTSLANGIAGHSVLGGAYARMAELRNAQGAPRALYAQGDVFAGECGGTLSVSSDHRQGNTDYEIRFNNFCMLDYSAETPQQTVIHGTVKGTEHGTPSDFGPIVSRASASIDRLTIRAGDETTHISLDGFNVEYGNPAAWAPEDPTAANPDRISLTRLTVDLASQGRVHTVSDVSARSWESDWDSVVDISSGRYASSAGWHVDIATSEPLVANWDGELIAGSIEITGSGNDTVTVKPSETAGGLLDITLNGQPIDQRLDCREAGEGLFGFLLF